VRPWVKERAIALLVAALWGSQCLAQPPKKPGESWADGFSNGYTTFFLSPAHGRGFHWGVGPVLYYPSATSSALGVNK
jgi:hypothetical protein